MIYTFIETCFFSKTHYYNNKMLYFKYSGPSGFPEIFPEINSDEFYHLTYESCGRSAQPVLRHG